MEPWLKHIPGLVTVLIAVKMMMMNSGTAIIENGTLSS